MNTSKSIEQEWPVEIRRSRKRKKSVQAKLEQGKLVILAPWNMSDEELDPVIERLRKRLKKKVTPIPQTDEELEQRAREINREYFDNKLKWHSIRFVTNQNTLYGSCTPATGKIRLSHRLASMPKWVRDYVIVHELAHLLEANHGPNFWKLVYRYELTERARGYLMAVGMEALEKELGNHSNSA